MCLKFWNSLCYVTIVIWVATMLSLPASFKKDTPDNNKITCHYVVSIRNDYNSHGKPPKNMHSLRVICIGRGEYPPLANCTFSAYFTSLSYPSWLLLLHLAAPATAREIRISLHLLGFLFWPIIKWDLGSSLSTSRTRELLRYTPQYTQRLQLILL